MRRFWFKWVRVSPPHLHKKIMAHDYRYESESTWVDWPQFGVAPAPVWWTQSSLVDPVQFGGPSPVWWTQSSLVDPVQSGAPTPFETI